MSTLFLLRRPGLIVCEGEVIEAVAGSVTIKGDTYLPVSRRTETRTARLTLPQSCKLFPRVGERIVAVTKDDFGVETLFNGAEPNWKQFDLKAYAIRYSGSFDFEEKNGIPEQHVFSGQVLSSTLTGNFTVTKMHIRVCGQNEVRYVVEEGSIQHKKGEPITVVTEKPTKGASGIEYYMVKRSGL